MNASATPATARITAPGCPLCETAGGLVVWSDAAWRVLRVEDADFPAFYRLVAADHVREFSDLAPAARQRCMALACAVERTLLAALHPTKMNLATLGNAVPHLHWHVVARFDWDSRFPEPIWAARQRPVDPAPVRRLPLALPALDALVAAALASA